MGRVALVHDVDLVSTNRSLFGAGVRPEARMYYQFGLRVVRGNDLLLVEIGPDMDNEHHEEHNNPTAEGTDSATEPFLIKDKVTDEDRSKDLRRPVHEIVEATCTDGEQSAVVIIEFCSSHQ